MKSRPKSKLSQWNAGEVLQAIPKIKFILETSPFNIKYRSLSQNLYLSPQSPCSSTKPVSRSKPTKDQIFKTQEAFSPLSTSLKFSHKRPSSTVSIDQHTQIENIVFRTVKKSGKTRKKYEIPVIKLEKNLPTSTKPNPSAQIAKGKGNHKNLIRRTRAGMVDQAVGNEFLCSQSSGLFSQTSLLNKYLSVYQADLNNY